MKRYVEQNGKLVEDVKGDWVRFEDVKEDLDFLEALQAAGVDSWEGYEEAQERLQND